MKQCSNFKNLFLQGLIAENWRLIVRPGRISLGLKNCKLIIENYALFSIPANFPSIVSSTL